MLWFSVKVVNKKVDEVSADIEIGGEFYEL
jgi:hypothetical protein